MRLLLLALLPACSLYFGPSHGGGAGAGGGGAGATPTEMVPIKSMAGEHTVVGVDSDRNGGLWILYRDQNGGFYATADVWVDHLDASLTKLSEWHYADDYSEMNGIAYTGDAVWLLYNEVATCNCHLRKLDPNTGATLGTFGVESGLADVAYGNGELLLSYDWNELIGMNPSTGSIDWTVQTPLPDGGAQRGITYADGNVWIASYLSTSFYLVDESGRLLATATSPVLSSEPLTGLEIAWDGTDLLAVVNNEIYWLEPR